MTPFLDDGDVRLYHGDAIDVLRGLPAESVDCVVTSPPYWGLRDYGNDDQLGLEATPDEYVANMVTVFRELRRVLADHGTCWLNLGDSYAGGGGYSPGSPSNVARQEGLANGQRKDGSFVLAGEHQYLARQRDQKIPSGLKQKDLVGIPWRVAFALQADGWWLRSDIIWAKPNPMPESVTDRPTRSHEYMFLLTKQAKYFFDQEAVREPHESTRWGGRFSEPNTDEWKNGSRIRERDDRDHYPDGGRNIRSVWQITTQSYPEAHFATFPEELARRCIIAGCHERGIVLDPFVGSGTVCKVARDHQRRAIGIDLNEQYLQLAAERLQQLSLLT